MIYKYFLYKVKQESYIGRINCGLSLCYSRWRENARSGFQGLLDFDQETVVNQLGSILGEKAKVFVTTGPSDYKQTKFVMVTTSYDRSEEVTPDVMAAACKYGLVYHDPQLNKTLIPNQYTDVSKNRGRFRARQICNQLRKIQDCKIIWKIRNVCSYKHYGTYQEYYAITIRKLHTGTVEDGLQVLYKELQSCVQEDEQLSYESKGITLVGEGYSVTFYIEGYMKHANQTWYVENGQLVSSLIRRMPYEQVFLWLNSLNEYERRDTLDRLHFNEMIHDYDNVLDRLAASVKLTKKLRKMPFPVTIGPITRPFGWYVRPFGDAVAFHAFFDSHDQDEGISMLNICEDDAIDILRFTTDILPYSADRYYEETHYPFQTMQAMVERLKVIKEILLHDPYSNLLTQYLPKDGNYPTRVDDIADRRFDIIKMFDLFNEWADKQITMYNYNSGMFVISGP